MRILLGISCLAFAMIFASASYGATITLNAEEDTWITPKTATANHENDSVSAQSGSSSTTNGRRYGVLQFDLSSVPGTITGASLQLYYHSGINKGTITQVASVIPITQDINTATLTFSIYTDAVNRPDLGNSDAPFDSLGTFTFTGPVPTDAYYNDANFGNWGDAHDAAFLESQRVSAYPHVGILLNVNSSAAGSTQTGHDWADLESGNPAQLMIQYTPAPEPSSIVLCAIGLVGLAFAASRRCENRA